MSELLDMPTYLSVPHEINLAVLRRVCREYGKRQGRHPHKVTIDIHPDLEVAYRGLPHFMPSYRYARRVVLNNEIGQIEQYCVFADPDMGPAQGPNQRRQIIKFVDCHVIVDSDKTFL